MSSPPSEPAARAPAPASRPASSSTRSKARQRALDILFEAGIRQVDPLATLAERVADAEPPVRGYTRDLVRGVAEHQSAIDERISAALAEGWSLHRLPQVDRTVLRIAVYEIDHTAVPDAVAVSEAVNLVSRLSTDESPAFVNGVLGSVVGTKRKHSAPPEPATLERGPATL